MSNKKFKELFSKKPKKKGGARSAIELQNFVYKAIKKGKKKANKKRLLRASKRFTNYLTSLNKKEKVFDFDTFNKLFYALLSEVYAEGSRDPRKIHPSSLRHECERKMFYSLKGLEYTDRVSDSIDGRVQMIFDLGHWFHGYIQSVLLEAGILIQAEVPVRDLDRHIDGRMDGLIIWDDQEMGLEIKTMNSYRFKIGKIAPFEDNEGQMGFYVTELNKKRRNKITKVCYLYFNKDTCEVATHIRDINKRVVSHMESKVDIVMDSLVTGVAPSRECCHSKIDEMAKSCPFRSKCFGK